MLTYHRPNFLLSGHAECPAGWERMGEWCATRRPSLAWEFKDEADEATVHRMELLLRNFAESSSMASDSPVPCPKGLAYLPYQISGIIEMARRGSVILGDDAGTGKTIQTAGLINLVKPDRVLIYAPTTLKINWENELRKWLVGDWKITSDPTKMPDHDILICSFGMSWRSRFTEAIRGNYYDMVVVDEAHNCKNIKSKQAQAVIQRIIRAKRKIFLTGTPVVNRPIELHPLLTSLMPDYWGDYEAYGNRYCRGHMEQFYNKALGRSVHQYIANGATRQEELFEILRSTVMVRRRKSDVLPQLPPVFRQAIVIPASTKSRGLLKAQNAEWAELLKKTSSESEALIRASMSDGAMLTNREPLALLKVPMALEHIKDVLETTEKVIVFAHHRSVVSQLMEGLVEYNPVKVVGSMSDEKKQLSVDSFQEGDARVFIGNLKAAGVGLTLTAASTVIFVEMDFAPAMMEQCEARAARIGQMNNVLAQYLVYEDSLDVVLFRMLNKKQKDIDLVMDGRVIDRKTVD